MVSCSSLSCPKSWPRTHTSPEVGLSSPPTRFKKVDFPLPLRPVIPTMDPCPTEFKKSAPAVEAAIKEHNPDIVINVGQAGGRSCVTVEKVGINLADARIPDNAGDQPLDEPLQADGPTGYFATIPVNAMVQNVRAHGLPCHVSFTAGTYVCNCVMYNVLHMCATKYTNIRAGFIHVPYACDQVVDKANGMASMPLETIAKSLEYCVEAVVNNTEDVKEVMGTTH